MTANRLPQPNWIRERQRCHARRSLILVVHRRSFYLGGGHCMRPQDHKLFDNLLDRDPPGAAVDLIHCTVQLVDQQMCSTDRILMRALPMMSVADQRCGISIASPR